jgi:hypothetical protein
MNQNTILDMKSKLKPATNIPASNKDPIVKNEPSKNTVQNGNLNFADKLNLAKNFGTKTNVSSVPIKNTTAKPNEVKKTETEVKNKVDSQEKKRK